MLTPSQDQAVSSRPTNSSRILLFDPSVGGHHPGYILHLIRYWKEHDLPGHLDILVIPRFMQQHGDVVEAAAASDRIQFVPMTAAEEAALGGRGSVLERRLRSLREWDVLAKYARQQRSTECLLMYFDTCQLPVVLRRPLPCPFSGIYFRPTFHYDRFPLTQLNGGDRWQQVWEKVYLGRVLGHPQLQTLFCLDPFVLEHFGQFRSRVQPVHLPDPVQIYGNGGREAEALKAKLGIEAGRQVFLLFGALGERKGLYQLLDAVALLPPALCQSLCLLLVGPISSKDQPSVQMRLEQLRSLPVQIVTQNEFVPDHAIEPYFTLSDVVLAPYQRHVGMSAILARAAAAQKPVLCSNFGLMGEVTRRYELGVTVDSTQATEVAKGLTQCLSTATAKLGNPDKMQAFAAQNTAEQFASVIFQHLHVIRH